MNERDTEQIMGLAWQLVALMERELDGSSFPWITHKHYTRWVERKGYAHGD